MCLSVHFYLSLRLCDSLSALIPGSMSLNLYISLPFSLILPHLLSLPTSSLPSLHIVYLIFSLSLLLFLPLTLLLYFFFSFSAPKPPNGSHPVLKPVRNCKSHPFLNSILFFLPADIFILKYRVRLSVRMGSDFSIRTARGWTFRLSFYMNFRLYACLFHPFICLFLLVWLCLRDYFSLCLCARLFVFASSSMYMFFYQSRHVCVVICLCICPSVCVSLSVCLSICVSTYLPMCLSVFSVWSPASVLVGLSAHVRVLSNHTHTDGLLSCLHFFLISNSFFYTSFRRLLPYSWCQRYPLWFQTRRWEGWKERDRETEEER